jgi:broad specificity phosphatase PhoE
VIRLILIRHGATEWNLAGRYQGQTDVPLGELGRAQAESVARRLRDEPITAVFCSDLSRARETAQIILSGRSVPITPTRDLREMSWGAWEGLKGSEAAERYAFDWAAWCRDPVNERPTGGGESFGELAIRVAGFYRSMLDRLGSDGVGVANKFLYRTGGQSSGQDTHETALVVSHGGLLRALLAQCFEIPLHLYWRFSIRPGSVTILDVYPEGPIAEVIGETSHLAVTSAVTPVSSSVAS